jgi:hypothetical protein
MCTSVNFYRISIGVIVFGSQDSHGEAKIQLTRGLTAYSYRRGMSDPYTNVVVLQQLTYESDLVRRRYIKCPYLEPIFMVSSYFYF